jgi:RNA polymerase sigma factor (TIGR02999 family)
MPDPDGDSSASLAPAEITALLVAVGGGDRAAFDRLFEAVYAELRTIAHRQLRRFSAAETLDTTSLVHEAFLKFSKQEHWSVESRGHFYRLAARAMRSVVIDRARRRGRVKRGGDRRLVEVDVESFAAPTRATELLAIDESLTRLETTEPELAQLVEWRFFAGLSIEEIAELLGVSDRTVKRRWRSARAFLYQDLVAQGMPA